MSSRVTCDDCGTNHAPIPHEDWQRLVAFYVEARTGTVPLRIPPDGPSLHLFLEACEYAQRTPGTPAWAVGVAHRYGAPVVRDLERGATEADVGDFAICNGVEYVWDGQRWQPQGADQCLA